MNQRSPKVRSRRPLPTADRRAPPKSRTSPDTCLQKEECASCKYVNDDYKSSLAEKYAKELTNFSSRDLLGPGVAAPRPLAAEKIFGYRCTMKLAVRAGREGEFTVGLFKPGTHEIVTLEHCPVHYRILSRFLRCLFPLLNSSNYSFKPWDEGRNAGDLRYVVVRCNPTTEDLQVVFVVRTPQYKSEFKHLVTELRAANLKIASSFLNINSERGNRIFGDHFVGVAGQNYLRIQYNGLQFHSSPASFLQVNPWMAARLYRRVADLVGDTQTQQVAWDLYAGIGPISMQLAQCGYRVWAAEENSYATDDLRDNAQLNRFKENVIEVSTGRTETCLASLIPRWAQLPTTIVVNPSRRGLDGEVRNHIGKQLRDNPKLEQVLYVACSAQTLARDLEAILELGGRLRQIESFDMFPHTDKLEWIATLTPFKEN